MKIFPYAFAVVALVCSAFATLSVKPSPAGQHLTVDSIFPDRFGEWREIDVHLAVLPLENSADAVAKAAQYRAYEDGFGRVVTVVAVAGASNSDAVRLHMPESCYVAQGFVIESRNTRTVELSSREAKLVALETRNPSRYEYVTYFLRDGDEFITQALEFELIDLLTTEPRSGHGLLFRLSSSGNAIENQKLHEKFLFDLTDELSPKDRTTLLGGGA